MTTDNRTNEPNQNETKSGQEFCFTEVQVEAAVKAHRKHGKGTEYSGIVCRECDGYFEDRAGFDAHRWRAALVAAQGATPQAESECLCYGADGVTEPKCPICLVLPSSTVDEDEILIGLRESFIDGDLTENSLAGFWIVEIPLEDALPTLAKRFAEWLKEQGR